MWSDRHLARVCGLFLSGTLLTSACAPAPTSPTTTSPPPAAAATAKPASAPSTAASPQPLAAPSPSAATASASAAPSSAGAPAAAAVTKARVVLIGNQRFGDQGPMDDMAQGLARCATDFGFETKKVESISASSHEDDVRAMAQQKYDMIMTTFPEMSPSTEKIASEFPALKFTGIYQFINLDGKSVPNVWDTEYRGDSTYYILGVVATMLSKSKKLGFISGSEDPTINASMNAFGQAVKATDPSATVEYAFAGSYEDPAKGNDIAKAMTQRGADVLTTAAAKTQLGVIDGAKAAKALFIGDVADNSKLYPEGFVGYSGSTFGQNVYLGCKSLADGTFQGGQHTFIDLTNGGYYIPYDAFQNWGKTSSRSQDADAIVKAAKDLEAKVGSGQLKISHNTDTPK